jgi:hypothetical protein
MGWKPTFDPARTSNVGMTGVGDHGPCLVWMLAAVYWSDACQEVCPGCAPLRTLLLPILADTFREYIPDQPVALSVTEPAHVSTRN